MQFKHHELSQQERTQFLEVFYRSHDKHPFSKWMKTPAGMITTSIWFISTTVASLIWLFFKANTLTDLAFNYATFIIGFMFFTIKFGAYHMWGHSMFLKYDEWKVGGMADNFKPVMFYAFYHHHSARDWCEDLSIRKHSLFGPGSGIRGVLTSHWHAYSIWFESRLLCFALLLWFVSPVVALGFFSGYEFAVYLLPTGHGWQHLDAKFFPYPLRKFYQLLEFMGVYANHKDHRAHHKHNHEYVYQSFTSSGLYSPIVDRYFDKVWNDSFALGEEGFGLIEKFYQRINVDLMLVAIAGLITTERFLL